MSLLYNMAIINAFALVKTITGKALLAGSCEYTVMNLQVP
jgi:hypothetical protein